MKVKPFNDGSHINELTFEIFSSGKGLDLLREWEKKHARVFDPDTQVMTRNAAVHDFVADIRRLVTTLSEQT